MIRSSRCRACVTGVEQFKKNASEATGWMDLTDSALNEVTSAMSRIRELTTQAATDTYDATQRKAIQSEVGQLIEHIGTLANTKYNEKGIFNGTKTDTAFVSMDGLRDYLASASGPVDGVFTDGDPTGKETESIQYEVSSGIEVQVNISPLSVFGPGTFQTLKKVYDALGTNADNNGAALSGMLKDIDEMVNGTVETRADLGARVNRMDLNTSRLEDQEIIAKTVMSDNEDIEAEKVIMELKSYETLHRAALSAGARIIQPTLLDFLR